MRVSRILIDGFQQFQSLDLDLTYPPNHPKAGKALEKICLIGRNGTGKSTLLQILNQALQMPSHGVPMRFLSIKLQLEEESVYLHWFFQGKIHIYSEQLEESDFFEQAAEIKGNFEKETNLLQKFSHLSRPDLLHSLRLRSNSNDLLIHSPPESATNQYLGVTDVPQTNLSDALAFFKHWPFVHQVSNENSSDFWKLLIYHAKNRESEFQKYLKKEENRQKTVEQVETNFDRENPLILDKLAQIWNRILADANLEFDVEHAKIPVQLNENLQAYIRLKESKERVSYNVLSTGMRNFIFRLGHIYLLYFQRTIQRGFLLLDEPENSLYPDFLYELIQEYLNIIHNTQLFVSTHNPIIAAQFEPCERIILDFNEKGEVFARKGHSPTGDDPNDLLVQDFLVKSLYGKEGQKEWNRFLALQTLIPKESDAAKKMNMLGEYLRLGSAYNFSVNDKLDDQK